MKTLLTGATLLKVSNLNSFYGQFHALIDVSLSIGAGKRVAIVGANGAGKSTLMQCIVGSQSTASGMIRLAAEDLSRYPAHRVVKKGVAIVPEGRRLFPSLTVEENLLIGGDMGRKGKFNLSAIYGRFPRLKERKNHLAHLLSGGEQQMVAIGRALMTNPCLLLCDELSLGLAPVMVQEIYEAIKTLKSDDVGVLFVEQDLAVALEHADYVYCMREGKIALEGASGELDRRDIKTAYFGLKNE